MDGGAWWAAVHGVAKSRTRLSNFTFTFHFHALEKEMATHSSVLAWRIPGTEDPGRLPSMGSHRVGHNWSNLAAAAATAAAAAACRKSIAGSYDKMHARTCQTVLQSGYTLLCSHQQCFSTPTSAFGVQGLGHSDRYVVVSHCFNLHLLDNIGFGASFHMLAIFLVSCLLGLWPIF